MFGRRPVTVAEVDEFTCVREMTTPPGVVAVTLYRMVAEDGLGTTGDHVTRAQVEPVLTTVTSLGGEGGATIHKVQSTYAS